jgi:hypothetical protein
MSFTTVKSTLEARVWAVASGEGVSSAVCSDSIIFAFAFRRASFLLAADCDNLAVVPTLSPMKTLSVHLSTWS